MNGPTRPVRSIDEDRNLLEVVNAMRVCNRANLSGLYSHLFETGETVIYCQNDTSDVPLWNILAARGWLQRLPARPVNAPNDIPKDVQFFRLPPEGRIPIFQLLQRFGPTACRNGKPASSDEEVYKEVLSRVDTFVVKDIFFPMLFAEFTPEKIMKLSAWGIKTTINELAMIAKKNDLATKLSAVDLITGWAKELLRDRN